MNTHVSIPHGRSFEELYAEALKFAAAKDMERWKEVNKTRDKACVPEPPRPHAGTGLASARHEVAPHIVKILSQTPGRLFTVPDLLVNLSGLGIGTTDNTVRRSLRHLMEDGRVERGPDQPPGKGVSNWMRTYRVAGGL